VTEPVLTLEIEGEERVFMVDTGAMVSLVQPEISKAQMQPCDVQARGVTGTQLEVLGEQKIEFILRNNENCRHFVHTFVVSPLICGSSGILGMDFLQRVGAEISLTAQLLTIGHHSFPLKGRELEVSGVRRLINAGLGESPSRDLEERKDEPVGDWEGTVELEETVTVPPFSVRIARCRVVRRNASAIVEVPRKQEVLVDPILQGLPGIFVARTVATLESNLSSSNAGALSPLVVKKSPLEVIEVESSPRVKCVVKKNDSAFPSAAICGDRKAGLGECLPELPEGGYGLPSTTTSHRGDLQATDSSLPVENRIGTQVDTLNVSKVQKEKGQVDIVNRNSVKIERKKNQKGTQVLGYVPMQIMNLSLEEVEVEKQRCVGVASPIQITENQRHQEYEINPIF
jgi:hypothetical protein